MDALPIGALNNREIATVIWLAVGLTWLIWKAKAWPAVRGVFRSFFKVIILRSVATMALYVAGSVWLLDRVGLWELSNLKTTVLWFGTFVLGWIFNLKRWQADPNDDAKTTLKEILDATVFVTFLTEFYTFSLPVELVFVPVVVFVAIMAAVAQRQTGAEPVAKLFNGILTGVGCGLLVNAVYQLFTDFAGFTTADNGREFVVPALLSLLFLPFMYAFNVYAGYEVAFMSLRTAQKDRALRRYAMLQSPFAFGLDVTLMRRWKTALYNLDIATKDDVHSSIAMMKSARERERRPPPVPADLGWSPHAAALWLKDDGMPVPAYNPILDEWSGSSPYRQLGGGTLGDSLAYYIRGSATAATKLTLMLNLDRLREGEAPEATLQAFSDAIFALLLGVFGDGAPDVARALKKPGHSTAVAHSTAAIVEGDKTLELVITHNAHVEPHP